MADAQLRRNKQLLAEGRTTGARACHNGELATADPAWLPLWFLS